MSRPLRTAEGVAMGMASAAKISIATQMRYGLPMKSAVILTAATRFVVLGCALLAAATPALGGLLAWGWLDESRPPGAARLLLYWPSLLLDALPPRFAEGFTRSAMPTVALYFAGYLLAAWALRGLVGAARRRLARGASR